MVIVYIVGGKKVRIVTNLSTTVKFVEVFGGGEET